MKVQELTTDQITIEEAMELNVLGYSFVVNDGKTVEVFYER